jgi:DNA-binding CsgD family transcriptional regulator
MEGGKGMRRKFCVFGLLLLVLFFAGSACGAEEKFVWIYKDDGFDKQEKHGLAPLSQTERHHLLLLPYDLTKQETKIALLLAENLNNSEICDSLNISENTLKTHLRNIYRKTKASGREDVQRIFS